MSRTAPQSTANTLTPSFATVSSTAGFQSGDLIYSKDNAYGTIPNNAVTSANFPISATVAAARTPYNQTVVNIAENPTLTIGNNGRQPAAATLSNGNIVVVGAAPVAAGIENPYFRIVDQNFTEVVASTQVTSVTRAYQGVVGVAALTGGGFVVAWTQAGSFVLTYAIYNNAGTQTVAPTDSGFGTSITRFDVEPLANGGFVLAGTNTSNTINTRTYTASGTPVSSVQSFGATTSGSMAPLIATLSTSAFSVVTNNSGSTITVYNCNTSGTFTTSNTIASNYSSSGQFSVTGLTDNTLLIAYTDNSANYINGYRYNPATATNTFIGYLNNSSAYSQSVTVQRLNGGGYVCLAASSSTSTARLEVYDNSNTFLGTTLFYNWYVNYSSNGNLTGNTTIIEGSTYLTLVGAFTGTTSYASSALPAMQLLKASPYTVRSLTNTTVQVAAATAAVNGYARSASTPNSAAFLAATTQTLSASVSPSSGTSFQLTPYSPTAETFKAQSMVTMQNGQFVLAYTTPTAVKALVFNPDGAVAQAFTVASGSFDGSPVQTACLGNGKLVVAYAPNSTTVAVSIYSTSYALLATGSNVASGYLSANSSNLINYGFGLAAIDNTRFVIGYTNNSSYPYVVVFDDTGAGVYGNNAMTSTTAFCVRVGAAPGGAFFVSSYVNGPNNFYVTPYTRTSLNGFLNPGFTFNIASSNNGPGTQSAVMLPSGIGCVFSSAGATTYLSRFLVNGSSTFTSYTVGNTAGNPYNNLAMCAGSSGDLMVFTCDTASRSYSLFAGSANNVPFAGGPASPYLNNSITLSDYNTNSDIFSSAPAITCLYGGTYAFSYRTSSNTMKVGLLSTTSATFSTTITAGVTASNTALIPSQSNGYYLAGVSASGCPAGGSGVVQTSGAATLNSQYPAGTTSQAFDFTSPTIPVGVKGTIAGRNLTIQGS